VPLCLRVERRTTNALDRDVNSRSDLWPKSQPFVAPILQKMLTRPVIVIVLSNPVELAALLSDLVNRFGADYRVAAHLTPEDAINDLEAIKQAGEQVALVIADQWMPTMKGVEVLMRAHAIHPTSQRALLVGWGDRSGSEQILEGCAFGRMDNYILKPWQPAEVHLYPFVSEFLAIWTRAHRPGMEVVKVIGDETSMHVNELRTLLERNGVPHGFYAVESEQARDLLKRANVGSDRLPVVILLDGHALVDPSFKQIADELGANDSVDQDYDLAIVGGGPAGLSAAVYAASEGLSTIVIEREAIGGQAGTSSLIRNYLGFPRGIGGAELAQRAYQQAWLFGAKFAFARKADQLRLDGNIKVITLSDGCDIRARSVIVSTGVSYRRLTNPTIERFVGAGVVYTAFTLNGVVRNLNVVVAGAGNSAGQAVAGLSKEASKVTMLVRGSDLTRSMSNYLIQQIEHLPNVEILYNTEAVEALGETTLKQLVLENNVTGERQTLDADIFYVLIGAEPYTDWLDGMVEREKGYIVTSPSRSKEWKEDRPQLPFETSLPGVFAVGDVRLGSMKRVASAAGEGSAAVASVHQYLDLLQSAEAEEQNLAATLR